MSQDPKLRKSYAIPEMDLTLQKESALSSSFLVRGWLLDNNCTCRNLQCSCSFKLKEVRQVGILRRFKMSKTRFQAIA